jgi:integrase/recombinase XerC
VARPSKPWFRSSRNAWFATMDGKKIPLGVSGEKNRAEAERAWHRLMANGHQRTHTGELPLSDAVESFFAAVALSLKPATVATYRRHLDRLSARFGTIRLTTMTPATVSRWLHSLPVGETTKAITLRSVSAFFGWCVDQQLLGSNPAATIPKPRTRSRGVEAVVPIDTHEQFLSLASPWLRPVLTLLYATGARPGEICRVTASDFDASTGVVRITEHKADKSGKPRLLFVSGEALQLLLDLAQRWPSGPLLRNRLGKSWTPKAIAWAMLKLSRRTGLKATAYGYRHTFATDALAVGVPDAQVAALLGHGSTAMLHRHYSHLSSKTQVLAAAAQTVRR